MSAAFPAVWDAMVYPTATDLGYRRLYYHLHQLVDGAIARILGALSAAAWPTTRSWS